MIIIISFWFIPLHKDEPVSLSELCEHVVYNMNMENSNENYAKKYFDIYIAELSERGCNTFVVFFHIICYNCKKFKLTESYWLLLQLI